MAGSDAPRAAEVLLPDLASLSLAEIRSAAPAAAAAAAPSPAVALDGVSLAALRAFAAAHAGQRFTLASGSTLPFEALTTTQVVEAVVKPATQHAGAGGTPCSYAQLLREQARARNGCCAARTAYHRPGPAHALARSRACRLSRSAHATCRGRATLSQDVARGARGSPHVAPATRFVSHAWAYPFADLLAALEARPEEGTPLPYYWLDMFTCNQHATLSDVPSDWWSNAFRDSVASIGLTVLILQPWNAPVPLTRSWCLVRAARPCCGNSVPR
jgi:hypothetical protein